MNALKKFFASESGATMVEYGLIVALISMVAFGALTLLSTSVNDNFTEAAQAVSQ